MYIDPGDEGVNGFVMISEVHDNEYTILLTDGKSKRVLESTLSPLPVGIDYMRMSEIEGKISCMNNLKRFSKRSF